MSNLCAAAWSHLTPVAVRTTSHSRASLRRQCHPRSEQCCYVMARGGASSAGELRANPGRGRSRTQLPRSHALGPRQLPGDCHGHTTDDSNSLDSKPGIGCLRPLPSLNALRRETVLLTRSQVPMQTRCTRFLAKDWKCSPHVLRGAAIGVCCLHDAHLQYGPRMPSALLKHAAKSAALVYSSQAVNSAAGRRGGVARKRRWLDGPSSLQPHRSPSASGQTPPDRQSAFG